MKKPFHVVQVAANQYKVRRRAITVLAFSSLKAAEHYADLHNAKEELPRLNAKLFEAAQLMLDEAAKWRVQTKASKGLAAAVKALQKAGAR